MKKIFLTLAIALSGYCSYAQTLNPTSNISAAGSVNNFTGGYTFSYLTAGSPWNGALISFGGFNNNYDCQISTDYGPHGGNHLSFRTRNGDAAVWNSWYEIWNSSNLNNSNANFSAKDVYAAGYVGIGATSPKSPLHVYQGIANSTGLIIQGNTINTDIAPHYIAMTFDGDYGDATGNYSQIRSYSNLYSNWGSQLAFFTTQVGVVNTLAERMRIDWFGNVGIGTSTPDAKLAVKGTIHTQEVKVDLQVPGPDYVFNDDYKLISLTEIKDYVTKNHHLPEIPSASQMAKEGIILGDMNTKLLKKVEELTLYAIDQQKQIEQLKKDQGARIAALETALTKLTNK